KTPKALMDIDGVGWDWSYMANEGEDHPLVADEETPTEFTLMANTEGKDGLDGKLAGLLKASKNLDHLIESQRSDQDKEGVGYIDVPPLAADLYLSPKKDLSWTGLPEFVDNTVTDYSRPLPTVASTSAEGQIIDSSTSEDVASPNPSKPFVMFVKPKDSNISYLSDFEPFDGGYVSFGQGGCKITGKGTIKNECIVLGRNLKLLDDANILLRTPRQHNMRLGRLNVKIMNKLVRHNLVRGLPTKSFDNDHTCTACLKGKHHKASCKSKLVNSVTKPLHTLHMDLFGPTSVSSISHKWYCLVVTDDFSRFTWTFFLRSNDETSDILKKFITEIENLKDLKVKIIRCDNGGEFRNKEMNDLCSQKGIKREFSNARTPQQNRVAEMRNRTLIEAARTMLADAKLPVTFWAKAVNTACYVQNRVLVNKSQNKTLYELFNGRTPAIGFLKPFGYHVMVLNTLYNLGKFEAKGDEGYFIGYSMSS
nr:hypothetical protein [Tanacetum cinerariifolium]